MLTPGWSGGGGGGGERQGWFWLMSKSINEKINREEYEEVGARIKKQN